ncbi:histidine kinase [Vulcanibacillus modesticaldus]|uniref:Signal transduction histidine-protein kinase/phosphatase DegS n=1 Tax=Vulcanibacillus modesticaldus TaxID=337097 RepID=A0A1D2YVK2_9BACI|nr:sensor histidine kinase [Vulcanibacillus modesticaldus]OEF99758.1 histidine kinase [Vulcanibacillus modesticaldus]
MGVEQKTEQIELEEILNKTIESIKKSKEQIFEIAEDARAEKETLIKKLDQINEDIKQVISEVDELELKYKKSRSQLVKVSKNFKVYSESDIQKAYEDANQFQIDLFIAREREVNLRAVRHDLQVRIKNIELTIERAESLITQISVVYDYLTNDFVKMSELVESNQLRQMFGLKIIQAQEEERKRVARDIHDGPAQSMANVVLRTEIAERLMNNNEIELARRELKDLKLMIRQSLADVRQIIFDLRPMVLDDLGLIPTLRKFIPEVSKRERLPIELVITGRERRFPSGLEVAIFRLIQELINNVIKHANASQVLVNVECAESFVQVMIRDNGVGFIEDEVMRDKNHFGLIGIRERIQLLEGELDIKSILNQGTTVIFKIPVKESGESSNESKG